MEQRRNGGNVKLLLPRPSLLGTILPILFYSFSSSSQIRNKIAVFIPAEAVTVASPVNRVSCLHSDHWAREEMLSPCLVLESFVKSFGLHAINCRSDLNGVCRVDTQEECCFVALVSCGTRGTSSPLSSSATPLERYAGAHLCPWVWDSHTPQLLPP